MLTKYFYRIYNINRKFYRN